MYFELLVQGNISLHSLIWRQAMQNNFFHLYNQHCSLPVQADHSDLIPGAIKANKLNLCSHEQEQRRNYITFLFSYTVVAKISAPYFLKNIETKTQVIQATYLGVTKSREVIFVKQIGSTEFHN